MATLLEDLVYAFGEAAMAFARATPYTASADSAEVVMGEARDQLIQHVTHGED